ncbi:MAG: 50S ribosomal protein L3 [Parcubacteria group bacterium GW2011_GWA1_47_8]|nr:MAG: 50S ribosomal protein L3 [Parcubacteria group bacterium GW2011_GWA1_47_8]KKW07863.1 MAG: 50S ribosomal protein L3 [Parcubacteria group bacterium GW2011_GWA2_49_16]
MSWFKSRNGGDQWHLAQQRFAVVIFLSQLMKFILGRKEQMVSFTGTDGLNTAATFIAVPPTIVTQVKSKDTDGYNAVQVGFGERAKKNISKAVQGHVGELGSFATIHEFRVDDSSSWKKGDSINAALFSVGDEVIVSGVSKGKGFQGVVKRHGFHGGPRSHGQKHSEREAGSIGGGGRAGGRVAKAMRMPGRMGSDRVSVKGLCILGVDAENGKILVSGCVPGIKGAILEIKAKQVQ